MGGIVKKCLHLTKPQTLVPTGIAMCCEEMKPKPIFLLKRAVTGLSNPALFTVAM